MGEVIRVNGKIAEINNMIDTLKGRMLKEKDGKKAPSARTRGTRKMEEVKNGEDVQNAEGIATKRDEPLEMDQTTVGRIKITLFLGTGARRRENLRIINGCKDAEELKVKMGTLRIWIN